MSELKTYILIRFNRKRGDIDTTLEGIGLGMLELWALQNLPKHKDIIIFDKETGDIAVYYEGAESFPVISYGKASKHANSDNTLYFDNVEDYCPGLLKICQKM